MVIINDDDMQKPPPCEEKFYLTLFLPVISVFYLCLLLFSLCMKYVERISVSCILCLLMLQASYFIHDKHVRKATKPR